jgi:hypothetical protein
VHTRGCSRDKTVRESDAHTAQIAEKSGDPQTAFNEYSAADATDDSKARLAAADYKVAEEWIVKCLAAEPTDRLIQRTASETLERPAERPNGSWREDDGNVVADAVLAEEALRRTDPLTP